MFKKADLTPIEGDLTGRVCVLREDALGKRWQRAKFQLVKVTGGFGCKPDSFGSKVYGQCLVDNEDAEYRRNDFIGFATDEQIEEALAEVGGEVPIDLSDVGFLAIGGGYWGRGKTLEEAKKNCKGRATVAFSCHMETRVTDIGYMSWPQACAEPVQVWEKKAKK